MNAHWMVLVACAVSALSGMPAAAQYITGKDWRDFSPEERATYATGLFDAMLLTGGAVDDEAIAEGLSHCAIKLRVSSFALAEAIDDFYAADPTNWEQPPLVAFHQQVTHGICLEHVNEARRERKLSDWK